MTVSETVCGYEGVLTKSCSLLDQIITKAIVCIKSHFWLFGSSKMDVVINLDVLTFSANSDMLMATLQIKMVHKGWTD